MDTLKEESSHDYVEIEIATVPPTQKLTADSISITNLPRSKCPSAIVAPLSARPSQISMLTSSYLTMPQKKQFRRESNRSILTICENTKITNRRINYNRQLGNDALTTALSALYAKLVIVLGIAFPVTEIISNRVPSGFYQGFYLYLYTVSIGFVIFTYATLYNRRDIYCDDNDKQDKDKLCSSVCKKDSTSIIRHGSFYLRLGAVAFGIGSMVYSGLDFAQYFELKEGSQCRNFLIAFTPATRMILIMVQIQFIFLNYKKMELNRHALVSKFGIMHMIATNLCEWLYVLVEETKHEIIHLPHVTKMRTSAIDQHKPNSSLSNITESIARTHASHGDIFECRRTNIMGSLVQNVSPFLFPCTVEYSLICAVILFEMWKNIKVSKKNERLEKSHKPSIATECSKSRNLSMMYEKSGQTISQFFAANRYPRSAHYFSVDCANAHRGLFCGILIIVMTIISLIMFFVLYKDRLFYKIAIYEINICEMLLYILTLLATVVAMVQMRNLKFFRKNGINPTSLCLDTSLLVMAQSGVFIYCMFSIIGSFFTLKDPEGSGVVGLLSEVFSIVQTAIQTMFILSAWWRRSKSKAQIRKRPGRQAVTFLLVANIALWIANTLEKGKAEFTPTHLSFFGIWPWTIITHVSMPMVIFYRFHSSICLFEIWKNAYKLKPEYH